MSTFTPPRSRDAVNAELTRLVSENLDSAFHGLVRRVLGDAQFWESPASIRHHHNYDGGLAEHTLEVLEGVLDLAKRNGALDRNALVLGALFHDWGKTDTYIKVPRTLEGVTSYGWQYGLADDLEGHIAIGYARFKEAAKTFPLNPTLEKVPSMILSHHGRKDWGSPVEPKFAEAWALHLADMESVFVICNRA